MSQLFPTVYSTLDPAALAAWFGDRYGHPDVKCDVFVRGVGDTYILQTDDTRFVLRVYRPSHRNLAQISAELALLLAAKDAGVSVSFPVADPTGEVIHGFEAAEGIRYGVVFSYAPGAFVSVLNEAQLRNLGRELARFHDVASAVRLGDSRWTYDPETTLTKPLEKVRPYFALLPEEYAWWRQAAERAIARVAQTDTSGFSSGYCHFDLLPQNFHFDGDSPTLFDFDFAGYGWLVYDLAIFRVHLDLDVHFGRQTKEAADAGFTTFLSAYMEQRPLSDDEQALIPWLGLSFWCFYMGFHSTHDQFYPLVQPGQLKARTALIRKLTEAVWRVD